MNESPGPEDSSKTQTLIRAETILPNSYAPFGELLGARNDVQASASNQGTSQRYNHLCDMQNLRPGSAKLNVCVFRVTPATERPVKLRILEKHPHSTQSFVPMAGAERFLVVVAQGKAEPDLSTLKAFMVEDALGISYRPGIWHHPLIALGPKNATADFICHVYEESENDFPENENTLLWNDPEMRVKSLAVTVNR